MLHFDGEFLLAPEWEVLRKVWLRLDWLVISDAFFKKRRK